MPAREDLEIRVSGTLLKSRGRFRAKRCPAQRRIILKKRVPVISIPAQVIP